MHKLEHMLDFGTPSEVPAFDAVNLPDGPRQGRRLILTKSAAVIPNLAPWLSDSFGAAVAAAIAFIDESLGGTHEHSS